MDFESQLHSTPSQNENEINPESKDEKKKKIKMMILLLLALEEIRNGEERLEELGFSWFLSKTVRMRVRQERDKE